MPTKMTLEVATKKYTKPDGSVELPADLLIIIPRRTKAIHKITKAVQDSELK